MSHFNSLTTKIRKDELPLILERVSAKGGTVKYSRKIDNGLAAQSVRSADVAISLPEWSPEGTTQKLYLLGFCNNSDGEHLDAVYYSCEDRALALLKELQDLAAIRRVQKARATNLANANVRVTIL